MDSDRPAASDRPRAAGRFQDLTQPDGLGITVPVTVARVGASPALRVRARASLGSGRAPSGARACRPQHRILASNLKPGLFASAFRVPGSLQEGRRRHRVLTTYHSASRAGAAAPAAPRRPRGASLSFTAKVDRAIGHWAPGRSGFYHVSSSPTH